MARPQHAARAPAGTAHPALRALPRAVALARAPGLPGAPGVRGRRASGRGGHARRRRSGRRRRDPRAPRRGRRRGRRRGAAFTRPSPVRARGPPTVIRGMSDQQIAIRDAPKRRTAVAEGADAPDLHRPELYDNRELSWVDFNRRVLELAEERDVPLLERAKFLAIFASNLDEFFMIRVAGVLDQVEAGLDDPGADGRTPTQVLAELRIRLEPLIERHTRCFEHEVRPQLVEHGICVLSFGDLTDEEREELDQRFRSQIFPVLTPLAVGLGRPFPYISNLSLSLALLVRDPAMHT